MSLLPLYAGISGKAKAYLEALGITAPTTIKVRQEEVPQIMNELLAANEYPGPSLPERIGYDWIRDPTVFMEMNSGSDQAIDNSVENDEPSGSTVGNSDADKADESEIILHHREREIRAWKPSDPLE